MEVIFSFCIQCHLSAHATNGHVKTFFFKVKVWNCTFKKKKVPLCLMMNSIVLFSMMNLTTAKITTYSCHFSVK